MSSASRHLTQGLDQSGGAAATHTRAVFGFGSPGLITKYLLTGETVQLGYKHTAHDDDAFPKSA